MEALRFQLKYLPKLIYQGHDEIVFRDTGGRGGVKKRTPKIDERPVPGLFYLSTIT